MSTGRIRQQKMFTKNAYFIEYSNSKNHFNIMEGYMSTKLRSVMLKVQFNYIHITPLTINHLCINNQFYWLISITSNMLKLMGKIILKYNNWHGNKILLVIIIYCLPDLQENKKGKFDVFFFLSCTPMSPSVEQFGWIRCQMIG